MSYLLRVRVPDRPGSLGALATALGRADADIVSLDVVARMDGAAVDDLLLELPLGRPADALVTAAHSVAGVRVESVRRYAGGADLHRDLDLLQATADAPASALATFAEGLPGVFRADWALLLDGGQAVYASSAAPDAPASTDGLLPLLRARHVEDTEPWLPPGCSDTAMAAAPVGRPDRVVLLGRVGGPDILDTELLRLAHLATLTAAVADDHGAADPAEPEPAQGLYQRSWT
jgi:hypothetical protein